MIFTGRHPARLIDTHLRDRFRSVSKDCVLVPLHTDEDVVPLRHEVRERALALKLTLVDQTKLVTTTSELARNAIKYAGDGEVQLELLDDGLRQGGALLFVDGGSGIADLALALTNGYTTGGGLGPAQAVLRSVKGPDAPPKESPNSIADILWR